MTYQSYMIGQDDPQPTPSAPLEAGPQVRIRDTVYSVTSNDGAVTESSSSRAVGNTSELNPHHGDGSILSTARHPLGLPVMQIESTTLVEVNGLQAPVAFWVKEGLIQKNADGTFSEASTSANAKPQEAPPVDPSVEHHPLNPHQMATVNAALADIDPGYLDGLAAVGMGVATGRLDAAALQHKFAQVSGHDGEAGQGRLTSIQSAYQAQADTAISSRFGVNPGDLGSFYSWARKNMQGQLTDAVMKQIHQHDVSGYRSIAARWLSQTAPSANALKAAGIPTRMQSQSQEVFVSGQWMSPGAATRAGLI